MTIDASIDVVAQRPAEEITEGRPMPMGQQVQAFPKVDPLVPGELLLGTLSDARLKIVDPICVRLSFDHDQIVAEAVALNEFGFGDTASEAVADVQRAIAQLYFSLEESSDRLGLDLQRTWATIQTSVEKTAPTSDDQAR